MKMLTKQQNLIVFHCFSTGQLLWNRWAEEWVVLYDDSTMAWFTVS